MKIAGLDARDIIRLSNGATVNLVEEVVAAVRRGTSRRGVNEAHIFDVVAEIEQLTGTSEDEIYGAFDIAYRDHRIYVDPDGFVHPVDAKKRRARILRDAPDWVRDPDLWKQARTAVGPVPSDADYWSFVTATYRRMGGRITGHSGRRQVLAAFVSRFRAPVWVQDPKIWSRALIEHDPEDVHYWGKVILSYKRGGGRVVAPRRITAEFKPRPFDVHPKLWTVSADGVLTRDIREIQSFLADGVGVDELESDLVAVGMARNSARRLIQAALEADPLI